MLLNKPGDAIIPPIGNLLGLIVAAWVSPGFVTFAAILAAFRFAAIGCAFLRLPCRRTSFRMLITHMADGARYLIADAINLGTDQAAMLILSFILSRAQLGLLGLCRQLITVSDTPGWSQIQAFYPGMVADPARNGPLLISRLRWIGIVSAASVALLTAPLGLWIYRAPGFLVLAPLLQVSTPNLIFACSLRHKAACARVGRCKQPHIGHSGRPDAGDHSRRCLGRRCLWRRRRHHHPGCPGNIPRPLGPHRRDPTSLKSFAIAKPIS